MSTAKSFSYRDLRSALIEVVDSLGIIDSLVDELVKYLDRRKVKKAERTIEKLKIRFQKLESAQQTISLQEGVLEEKIESLEERKGLHKGDILTLGLIALLRSGYIGLRKNQLKKQQEFCSKKIEEFESKSEAVKKKIASLEETMNQMRDQDTPSLLERIVNFLRALKKVIVFVMDVVRGKTISAFLVMC